MGACRTCELGERRDAGRAPLWDCIKRTASWDVVHAFGTGPRTWSQELRYHARDIALIGVGVALFAGAAALALLGRNGLWVPPWLSSAIEQAAAVVATGGAP